MAQLTAGAAGGGLLTAGDIIQAPDTLVKWDNSPLELLGGGLLTAGEIIQAPDTQVKWDNMPPELLAGDNSPLERSYNPPILR